MLKKINSVSYGLIINFGVSIPPNLYVEVMNPSTLESDYI